MKRLMRTTFIALLTFFVWFSLAGVLLLTILTVWDSENHVSAQSMKLLQMAMARAGDGMEGCGAVPHHTDYSRPAAS